MSLPFLKAESEETATQGIAFIGVAILTVGLLVMNVSGAIAGSTGTSPLEITIRTALAVVLSGAELLAAVAVVRVMLAPTKLRMILGGLIFIGLAWACIQNGKRAVHLIYPEFKESAALLEAKAGIAGDEAKELSDAKTAANNAVPDLLAGVQQDIAEVKSQQRLLRAQSPEKIAEMQQMLITHGYYFFQVDGKIGPETEKAMRSMGEDLRIKLETLEDQESNLMAGVTTVAVGAASPENPAIKQAELKAQADKARSAAIWLEVMLWVFEGARSLGLWVYVTTITAKNRTVIDGGISEDVPDGHIRVEIPQAEWEAMQEAMRVHGNIKQGAKKGATTRRRGNKIEATRQYMEERVSDFMTGLAQGKSPAQVAASHGLTLASLEASYGRYFTAEEYDAFFGSRFQPEPEAEPPVAGTAEEPEPPVAMADSPQDDELTIPEEPKEYPVGFPEPPANDEPDGKEAA